MQGELLELLQRYFNDYGYWIIFLALLFENFFVTGLLIPGETVLLLGAVTAGNGTFNIFYVVLVAFVAALIGNIIGYYIGMRGGRPFIERFGGRFISTERIKGAEEYFDSHGPKTVFVGRFAAGVRVFVPLLAGAAKMNFAKFLGYTTAAITLWTVALSVIGYYFGQNLDYIKKIFGNFTLIVLVVVVGFIVFYVVRRKREATSNRNRNHQGV
ncbi:MAG: DedA family protein [Rubrobacteridae bacterium]|nr:DedA family protein [Rubrobacteridae bacterium]